MIILGSEPYTIVVAYDYRGYCSQWQIPKVFNTLIGSPMRYPSIYFFPADHNHVAHKLVPHFPPGHIFVFVVDAFKEVGDCRNVISERSCFKTEGEEWGSASQLRTKKPKARRLT